DDAADTLAFDRSLAGGVTWDGPRGVAVKRLPFDIAIPAEFSRGALVYPACDADRSTGAHRGRLYCSWMDLNANGNTDIFASDSDDGGTSWSAADPVTDQLAGVDRFNHWMAVDPITGEVNVSFYDTRNDTTGARFETDIYFTQLSGGGDFWLLPNGRLSADS